MLLICHKCRLEFRGAWDMKKDQVACPVCGMVLLFKEQTERRRGRWAMRISKNIWR